MPTAPFAWPAPRLTPREAQLLVFFLNHPDRVYTRRELLAHVWGIAQPVRTRTVDVHLANLRRKLAMPDNFAVRYRRGYLYTPCTPAQEAFLRALAAETLRAAPEHDTITII